MGDEKVEMKTGPYKGYFLDSDENVLTGDGEYNGQVLASCSAKDGYLRVPGQKYTGEDMSKLRESLNIGTSKLFLDNQALVAGTICVQVDDPGQNTFAINKLDDECPIDDGKCKGLTETIEGAKPEGQGIKWLILGLILTCPIGFGMLTPLGTMALHAAVEGIKKLISNGTKGKDDSGDDDPNKPTSPGGGKKRSALKTGPESSADGALSSPNAGNGATVNEAPFVFGDPSPVNIEGMESLVKKNEDGDWVVDEEALRKYRMSPEEIGRERETEEAYKDYQKLECEVTHCDGELNAIDSLAIGAAGLALAWWALPKLALASVTAAATAETATVAAPVAVEIGSVPAWLSAATVANDVIPWAAAAGFGGLFVNFFGEEPSKAKPSQ